MVSLMIFYFFLDCLRHCFIHVELGVSVIYKSFDIVFHLKHKYKHLKNIYFINSEIEQHFHFLSKVIPSFP